MFPNHVICVKTQFNICKTQLFSLNFLKIGLILNLIALKQSHLRVVSLYQKQLTPHHHEKFDASK